MPVKLTARKYVRIEIDVVTFSQLLQRNGMGINNACTLSNGGTFSTEIHIYDIGEHRIYDGRPPDYGLGYVVTPVNGTFSFGLAYSHITVSADKYRNSPYPDPHLMYFFNSTGSFAEFYLCEQYYNFWSLDAPGHDSTPQASIIWKRRGVPTGIHDDDNKPDDWTFGWGFFYIFPTPTNYRLYNITINPTGLSSLIGSDLSILFGSYRPYLFVRDEYKEQSIAKVPVSIYQTVYDLVLGAPLGDWNEDIMCTDLGDTIRDIVWGTCPSEPQHMTMPATCYDRPEWLRLDQEYYPILVARSEFADALSNSDGVAISAEWRNSVNGINVYENILDEAYLINAIGYAHPIYDHEGNIIQDPDLCIADIVMVNELCESGLVLSDIELSSYICVSTELTSLESEHYLFYRRCISVSSVWYIYEAFRSNPPMFFYLLDGIFKKPLWYYVIVRHIYPNDRYLNVDGGWGVVYSRAFQSRLCAPSFDNPLYDIEQSSQVWFTFLDEQHEFFDFSVDRWQILRDQTGRSFIFL